MLTEFSNQLADAVDAAAGAVVQVRGHGRPASGVVLRDNVIVTTTRAIGRDDDNIRVRRPGGDPIDARLVGWDPATSLAVLKVEAQGVTPIATSTTSPRVGHVALALARSWSNGLTASAGIVSIIGGPLRTGRRHSIAEVIRTTAPMHEGFAGGAFVDTAGALIGIATASELRGLSVVIPAGIVVQTTTSILEHGRPRRGYLGLIGQGVKLSEAQRVEDDPHETALLVAGVAEGSPAARAGLLVGDILVSFDGKPVESPDDLLDLLSGDKVGRTVPARISRGGQRVDLSVTVEERPTR